jgi:predicted SAM-dependent methyltransferase
MAYHSEAAKVRDMSNVMKYVQGKILDIGCGPDKITTNAIGVDGRNLEGVDVITDNPYHLAHRTGVNFDTVFSSHFLEHLANDYEALVEWISLLTVGGHLVLYLPCGTKYNNRENPEHMRDMKYDDFIFWFRRAFCGEGKDFRGHHLLKLVELVDHATDYGEDRYSFYVIARKV